MQLNKYQKNQNMKLIIKKLLFVVNFLIKEDKLNHHINLMMELRIFAKCSITLLIQWIYLYFMKYVAFHWVHNSMISSHLIIVIRYNKLTMVVDSIETEFAF